MNASSYSHFQTHTRCQRNLAVPHAGTNTRQGPRVLGEEPSLVWPGPGSSRVTSTQKCMFTHLGNLGQPSRGSVHMCVYTSIGAPSIHTWTLLSTRLSHTYCVLGMYTLSTPPPGSCACAVTPCVLRHFPGMCPGVQTSGHLACVVMHTQTIQMCTS